MKRIISLLLTFIILVPTLSGTIVAESSEVNPISIRITNDFYDYSNGRAERDSTRMRTQFFPEESIQFEVKINLGGVDPGKIADLNQSRLRVLIPTGVTSENGSAVNLGQDSDYLKDSVLKYSRANEFSTNVDSVEKDYLTLNGKRYVTLTYNFSDVDAGFDLGTVIGSITFKDGYVPDNTVLDIITILESTTNPATTFTKEQRITLRSLTPKSIEAAYYGKGPGVQLTDLERQSVVKTDDGHIYGGVTKEGDKNRISDNRDKAAQTTFYMYTEYNRDEVTKEIGAHDTQTKNIGRRLGTYHITYTGQIPEGEITKTFTNPWQGNLVSGTLEVDNDHKYIAETVTALFNARFPNALVYENEGAVRKTFHNQVSLRYTPKVMEGLTSTSETDTNLEDGIDMQFYSFDPYRIDPNRFIRKDAMSRDIYNIASDRKNAVIWRLYLANTDSNFNRFQFGDIVFEDSVKPIPYADENKVGVARVYSGGTETEYGKLKGFTRVLLTQPYRDDSKRIIGNLEIQTKDDPDNWKTFKTDVMPFNIYYHEPPIDKGSLKPNPKYATAEWIDLPEGTISVRYRQMNTDVRLEYFIYSGFNMYLETPYEVTEKEPLEKVVVNQNRMKVNTTVYFMDSNGSETGTRALEYYPKATTSLRDVLLTFHFQGLETTGVDTQRDYNSSYKYTIQPSQIFNSLPDVEKGEIKLVSYLPQGSKYIENSAKLDYNSAIQWDLPEPTIEDDVIFEGKPKQKLTFVLNDTEFLNYYDKGRPLYVTYDTVSGIHVRKEKLVNNTFFSFGNPDIQAKTSSRTTPYMKESVDTSTPNVARIDLYHNYVPPTAIITTSEVKGTEDINYKTEANTLIKDVDVKLTATNNSAQNKDGFDLIDVLPFKGDGALLGDGHSSNFNFKLKDKVRIESYLGNDLSDAYMIQYSTTPVDATTTLAKFKQDAQWSATVKDNDYSKVTAIRVTARPTVSFERAQQVRVLYKVSLEPKDKDNPISNGQKAYNSFALSFDDDSLLTPPIASITAKEDKKSVKVVTRYQDYTSGKEIKPAKEETLVVGTKYKVAIPTIKDYDFYVSSVNIQDPLTVVDGDNTVILRYKYKRSAESLPVTPYIPLEEDKPITVKPDKPEQPEQPDKPIQPTQPTEPEQPTITQPTEPVVTEPTTITGSTILRVKVYKRNKITGELEEISEDEVPAGWVKKVEVNEDGEEVIIYEEELALGNAGNRKELPKTSGANPFIFFIASLGFVTAGLWFKKF